MIKKIFYFNLVVCLLIGGIKLYTAFSFDEEAEVGLEKDMQIEEKNSVFQSSPSEKAVKQKSLQVKAESKMDEQQVEGEEKFSQSEMDKFDERYEKIEVSWLEESKKFFTVDLKLSEQEYGEYLTMREGFEEDRFEAYQNYHKENLEKKGDYPITVENESNDRILDEYQKLFKDRFGEEALAKYLKSLDDFNSDLRKNEGQDGSTLTIDF